MRILTVNTGSSSIKWSVFEAKEGVLTASAEGSISGIGGDEVEVHFRDAAGGAIAVPHSGRLTSLKDGGLLLLKALQGSPYASVEAVGYRVVHPGEDLEGHQLVTEGVLEALRRAAAFAPLHDPEAVELIEALRQELPNAAHVVCFDTEFHRTMPREASTYALPRSLAEPGIHRYGAHGLSCESIVAQLEETSTGVPERMTIAHLGGGSSVTALRSGRSVDTSMGLTPTGGVVMSTRIGDVDPGLLFFLLRKGSAPDALEAALNHESGIAGLAGAAGDMRAIRKDAEAGQDAAALALAVYTRGVRKAIGGFMALLGGLDAIVFAGGIGENDARTRSEILADLEELGITLDAARNDSPGDGIQTITDAASRTKVLIVPAKEDWIIARHVLRLSAPKAS